MPAAAFNYFKKKAGVEEKPFVLNHKNNIVCQKKKMIKK